MGQPGSHSSLTSSIEIMLAKKSLGQNFLRSGKALASIVGAGKVSTGDLVLEIGPGRGALTNVLLGTGATVVAVEKDHELVTYLSDKFKEEVAEGRLRLIEGDILNLKASDILPDLDVGHPSYKLIANIPYYITGEVIRKFLEEEHPPSLMVLLVQKEVAERIVVRDGKQSILSIAVRAYCAPRYMIKVPRTAFSPAPNVDSAVVLFDNISNKFFEDSGVDEQEFFTLVKAGFAHKRKKLGGNLKAWLKNRPAATRPVFDSYKDKRAEELSLEDWKELLENQI